MWVSTLFSSSAQHLPFCCQSRRGPDWGVKVTEDNRARGTLENHAWRRLFLSSCASISIPPSFPGQCSWLSARQGYIGGTVNNPRFHSDNFRSVMVIMFTSHSYPNMALLSPVRQASVLLNAGSSWRRHWAHQATGLKAKRLSHQATRRPEKTN